MSVDELFNEYYSQDVNTLTYSTIYSEYHDHNDQWADYDDSNFM